MPQLSNGCSLSQNHSSITFNAKLSHKNKSRLCQHIKLYNKHTVCWRIHSLSGSFFCIPSNAFECFFLFPFLVSNGLEFLGVAICNIRSCFNSTATTLKLAFRMEMNVEFTAAHNYITLSPGRKRAGSCM